MKETCIICNVETPYNIHDHIDLRDYYIEGAGQLCRKCYYGDTPEFTKEAMLVPIDIIESTPNDLELGEAIRKLYWEYKK